MNSNAFGNGGAGKPQEPPLKRVVPVTRVMLKDKRMGVIRESKTTIKHLKRCDGEVAFFPEVGESGNIKANLVERYIVIT